MLISSKYREKIEVFGGQVIFFLFKRMTTFFLVKETLHDNLKVLGFESFLSHHKHAKDFNFDS